MFRIDQATNSLERLARTTFSALSMSERKHLQEWIAASPDCLGEDILIIQKEFDGFDETRERLDLLAIDKQGRLVVIENKLDDTGRDVVWQALKYASYCSTLKTVQIVEIYSRYLRSDRTTAEAAILEFLEEDSFDEVVLNKGNEQRIFLIAANFRKEVTATALWLLAKGIDVCCFRVSPFRFGTEVLLNFEQIIPPPEAADYMIGMSEKEAEASVTERAEKHRHHLRREFWANCLDAFRQSDVRRFDSISPGRDHWQSAGSGIRGCPLQLIFSKDEARVQIDLATSNRTENKRLFDYLFARKDVIEVAFGHPLIWKRLDDRKSSRLEFQANFDSFDKAVWPEIIDWMIVHMRALDKAVSPQMKQAAASARTTKTDDEPAEAK